MVTRLPSFLEDLFSVAMLPFLPQSWEWKIAHLETKHILQDPIFHFRDYGRKSMLVSGRKFHHLVLPCPPSENHPANNSTSMSPMFTHTFKPRGLVHPWKLASLRIMGSQKWWWLEIPEPCYTDSSPAFFEGPSWFLGIEPKNEGLEDNFPFPTGDFQVPR